jgi:uncharacterized protein HemY
MSGLKSVQYLKDIAKTSANGNYDVIVGEHYLRELEWGRAAEFLERGITKGSLSDKEKAYHLLGKTYHCLGLNKLASQAYSKVVSDSPLEYR